MHFTMVSTKFSLRIVPFLFAILSSTLSCFSDDYMLVHPCRVEVNDSLCYLIKKGYVFSAKERKKGKWEFFCGELANFYFVEGYSPNLKVKEYNPHADTIYVIKTPSRLSSICQFYKKAPCDCEKLRGEIKRGKTAEECDCSTINVIETDPDCMRRIRAKSR